MTKQVAQVSQQSSLVRIWLLLRLLWKSGSSSGLDLQGSPFDSKKGKKGILRGKVGKIVVMILSIAYLSGIMVFNTLSIVPPLIAAGQDRLFFELYMPLFAVMTMAFGFFYTFSSLAFASDQERVSAMPFRSNEVLIARMILVAVNQTILPLIMGVPAFYTYGYLKGMPWIYYVKVPLTILVQSIVPVGIMVMLTVFLMRLTPLAKNRDRFMVISQIAMMIVMFAVFFKGGDMFDTKDQNMLLQTMQNKPLGVLFTIIPNLNYLIDFMLQSGKTALLAILKAVLISLVFVLLAYLIAGRFYSPELASGGASGKKLSNKEKAKVLHKKSVFAAVFSCEWKQVTRNHSLLMNSVVGEFIFIAMLLVGAFVGMSKEGSSINLPQIRQSISTYINSADFEFLPIITIASLAMALFAHFATGMTTLNASAFSRQGQEIFHTMIQPVPVMTLYLAKSLISVLASMVPYLLIFIIFTVLLGLPFYVVIIPILYFIWAGINSNLWPLLLDANNPTLDWENEMQAIKNNKNVFFAMIASWGAAGVIGFLFYATFEWELEPWQALAALTAFLMLQTILCIWLIPKAVKKTYNNIEEYL